MRGGLAHNCLFGLMAFFVAASATEAVQGDINLDGVVDLEDFFLLADSFGNSGPPQVPDSVIVTLTLHDTVYVSIHDTVHQTVIDTLYLPALSSTAQVVLSVSDSTYVEIDHQSYLMISDVVRVNGRMEGRVFKDFHIELLCESAKPRRRRADCLSVEIEKATMQSLGRRKKVG